MTEKDYLASLDRRVTGHDAKFAEVQRDYSEVTHEVKEVLNRINGGLSPSINKVKDDNGEIKISLKDLSHHMDISMMEMRNLVRESTEHTRLMVDNANKNHAATLEGFEKDKLAPVAAEVGMIKKTFIYGLVGAVIVFLGQRGMNAMWDRIFTKEPPRLEAPK